MGMTLLRDVPDCILDTIGPWLLFQEGRRSYMNIAPPELIHQTTVFHGPTHELSAVPFLQSLRCVHLTEDMGEGWRMGTAFSLKEVVSTRAAAGEPSKWAPLCPKMMEQRFAEYVVDGRAYFILTSMFYDGPIVFFKAKEIDGGKNLNIFGTIDRKTGFVTNFYEGFTQKVCPFCTARNSICDCAPSLTQNFFERELMARQSKHRLLVPGKTLHTRLGYNREWLSGQWTHRVNGVPAASIQLDLNSSEEMLRNTLSNVLQLDMERLIGPSGGLLSTEDSNFCTLTMSSPSVDSGVYDRPMITADERQYDFSPRSSSDTEGDEKNQVTSVVTEREEDEKAYKCPICNRAIKRKSDIARHVRFVHKRIRKYQCTRCPRAFLQSCHLKDHMRGAHAETSENMCPVCGKHFGMSSKLKRHILTVHEDKRNFKCNHCEKAYKDKQALAKHVARHHNHTN